MHPHSALPAHRRCTLAAALAAAFAAAGLLAPPPAVAQAAVVAPPVAYAIPAGPLQDALTAFAKASGVLLAYQPELVRGLASPGLQGRLAPAQALAALLAGTGLQAAVAENGTWTLRRAAVSAPAAPAAAAAAPAATALPEVKVTAQAERDGTTEGTGSYTQRGPSATATGLALTLRETPQSVTVMTRQRMDDFKLETLTDALEQTPGVTVARQNDRTTFSVRGSDVNLQTDGVRQFSNGWGWNSHILYAMDDLAEIDRIEVLKGSSGLVNGDGGYGATVNLVRKRPTREFQASVAASAGSWDTWRTDVDVAGPLNASASLRGRLVASYKDGKSFSGQRRDNTLLYGTAELDLTPDTLLSAGLTWRQRELRGATGTTPIQGYSGTGAFVGWTPRSFNAGAPWAGYEQDALSLFARLEHRFAGGWTAKLQLAHERIDTPEMRIGTLRFALPATSAQYGIYRDMADRNRSATLELRGPFTLLGREHQLLLGAGVSRNRTTLLRGSGDDLVLAGTDYATGGAAVPPLLQDLTYSNDLFSSRRRYVYAAGNFHLAEPVRLIAGARVSDYAQKDVTDIGWYNYDLRERGVVTPYAGVVVDVSREVSLYASYASIYNAQTARDAAERTLPPEEGLTYEIGAKGEFFDQRLNASLSYFWMKTDNTAEEVGQTPAGESIYRPVMGATRRGYELELSGELARHWQAQGSYVMHSSDLDSASSNPKHQFKLGSTYRFADGALQGLTLGAAARWQSAISVSRNAATLRQDAYWLFDLMARYQVNRQLSISANVGNLFDKRYFAGVTNFNAQGLFYTWGTPRNLSLKARYEF